MRRFLAWAAVLSFALPSVAASQVVVGLGGGLRSSSLSIDDAGDDDLNDSRTGIGVFGFVSIPVNESFSIQPGVGYGQRGASDSDVDATLELDYLEVPILGVYHLPSEGAAAFHLFAGPVIAFELNCAITDNEGTEEDIDCDDPEVDLGTKSTEFGAAVGAAVSYGINDTASLFLSAFYNLGLTDVSDDSGDEGSAKHRTFGVNVGVSFPVGG